MSDELLISDSLKDKINVDQFYEETDITIKGIRAVIWANGKPATCQVESLSFENLKFRISVYATQSSASNLILADKISKLEIWKEQDTSPTILLEDITPCSRGFRLSEGLYLFEMIFNNISI